MDTYWKLTLSDNRILHGSLTDTPDDSVLCFSMMAPVKAISGCKVLHAVAGYTELSFNNGTVEDFQFAFDCDDFQVFNAGWLPAKPYLRLPDGTCHDLEISFTPQNTSTRTQSPTKPDNTLRLVPQPTEWRASQGYLNTTNGFSLNDTSYKDALLATDALAQRNGLGQFLGTGTPITIRSDFDGPKDGYTLTIADSVIEICAKSRTGVFYGAISLLNLKTTYADNIPCGKITDAPRFAWRGQQLDCARHFFQPNTILRLIDLMAMLKLNRFHWHFNDDEAFRLEVECYPEIWQKTRFRGEGEIVPGVFGGGQGPTGGSYSLAFARELIAHAADLEIEVLPEIEIPAHAYAITRIFPKLRDPEDKSAEVSVQGYRGNSMNPAMPFTKVFTETLLTEIASIFPFNHIHVGCDERPPLAWDKSPVARGFMAKSNQNLETLDDLQGWMIEQTAQHVATLNAQPCAWEEAVKGNNGGLGNGAILFSWTGQGPGLEAARQGYQVVMSPAQHLYFDHAYTTDFNDIGARWAGVLPLEETVNWLPIPADEPDLKANIIGVEGAFWSEFTTDDTYMETMLAPRILGLAEMAWRDETAPATPETIQQSATEYHGLFTKIGWSTASF